MRIVGLDLSLTGTGVAAVWSRSGARYALLDRVKSPPAGDEWAARWARIVAVVDEVRGLLGEPELVVLEAPAYSRTTGHVHDRAGLWWTVYRHLHYRDIPVLVVTPNKRAKYATGKGTAGKDEVLAAVVRRYPWADVENNDHADALTLAAMGARLLGQPVEESLPQAHLAAMDGLSLPGML